MSDQYGNTVDGEIWVPVHNHFTRDIRPPGYCLACDEHHDKAMGVKPLSEYLNASPERQSINYRKMGRGG